MPTSGELNGSLLGIYIGSTKIGYSTGDSMSVSREVREVTSKDSSGWTKNKTGKGSFSFSGDYIVALDQSDYGIEEIVDAIIGGNEVTVKYSTEVTGDTFWTGNGHFTQSDVQADVEGNVTGNWTITGTGALSKGNVP